MNVIKSTSCLSILLAIVFVLPLNTQPLLAAPSVKKAIKSFKKKKYEKAAGQFWRILKEAEEGSEEFETANYFIGQSLHRLGLYHAAAEYFYSIVRSAGNTEFITESIRSLKETLEGRSYDTTLLVSDLLFSVEFAFLPEDLNDFVQFYQGLHSKRKGYERWARAHFKKIRPNTYYYYRVRYIDAVEELKKENFDKALAILQEIIDAEFDDIDMKGRARQAIARLKYERKKFREALDNYKLVNINLNKQASVFLEKGWANYFLKDYKLALGSLHSLQAPIYEGFFDAEKFVIRMLIYKELCMFPAAREVLADYKKEYGKAVTMIKEREDLASSKRLLSALFWSFGFKQRYDFLESLKIERDRLKKHRKWKRAGFRKHLDNIYDLKTQELDQALTAETYDGLQLVAEKLLDQNEQMNLLTYEVRLDELKRVKLFEGVNLVDQEKIPLTHGGKIYWPFDGEYWTDEMQQYRFLIQDQCKALVIR